MSKLSAPTIVELLQTPTEDRRPIKRRIAAAPVSELLGALQLATTPLVRTILCEILGRRCVAEAVPILVEYLGSADPGTQNEAALALARIGDSRAGPPLLEHYTTEEDAKSSRRWITSALGAVGYRPAIPALILALADSDPVIRGLAAWSLGILGAVQAESQIHEAYTRETLEFARENMQDALAALQVIALVLSTEDRMVIQAQLTQALTAKSTALRGAAAWAIGALHTTALASVLQQRLTQEKICFVAARMRDALMVLDVEA